MEKKKKRPKIKYESGILGEAQVCFGGKIQLGYGLQPAMGVAFVDMAELKVKQEVGKTIENKEHYDPQVILCFDNLESINQLRLVLNEAEYALKHGKLRKNDEEDNV